MKTPDFSSPLVDLMGAEAGAQLLHHFWAHRVFHVRANASSWPEFLKHKAWKDAAELGRSYSGPLEVTKGSGGQYNAAGIGIAGAINDLGLVARLSQPQAIFPELESWLKSCELELGVPEGSARLNAFVNPAGLGLNAHCDPTDHILIQLFGNKEVRLLPNPSGDHLSVSHALGVPARPRDALQFHAGFPQGRELPESAESVLLTPGSVLLIPRGMYHQTRGGAEGLSSTLVLNVNAPTPIERCVSFLRDYLVQDANWRRPFAQLEPAEQRGLIQDLCVALQSLPLGTVFGPSLTSGSEGAEKSSSRDRFLRDPAISVQVNTGSDAVQVGIVNPDSVPRERFLKLGSGAGQVLAHIAATRTPFDLSELGRSFPGWDAASLSQLVSLLVRHGALLRLSVPAYGVFEAEPTARQSYIAPSLRSTVSQPLSVDIG